MNRQSSSSAPNSLEEHSRALFHDSVESVDMRVRSRLTQARHAALDAAAVSSPRPWFMRLQIWTPAAGMTAAVALGVALWVGHAGTGVDQPNLDDLEIVAASDANSADAIEMLQDDLEFYDFADKAAVSEPPA